MKTTEQEIKSAAIKCLAEFGTESTISELLDHIEDDNAVLKLKFCKEAIEGAIKWAISLQPEWEWNVIDFDNQETFPLEDDPVLCFTDDGLQLLQLTKYGQNVVSWEWTTCFSKPVNKSFPIDFVSQWKNVNESLTK